MANMRRWAAGVVLLIGLGGCVLGRNPDYPSDWALPDAGTRVGMCPSIAGVYSSPGQLALDSGIDCGKTERSENGDWQCSMDLAKNLGLSDGTAIVNAGSAGSSMLLANLALPHTATPLASIAVVEVDGPRDGVVNWRFLEAPGGDGKGAMSERGRRQWREVADYVCESGWLVLSDTRVATSVVANRKARFTRAGDGSLVVERRNTGGGVLIVVPMYISTATWFRYLQAPAS